MSDEYFFEFVVGPPVEYLVAKLEEQATQRPEVVPVSSQKPKGRTMWDLPDPFMKGKQ